MVVTKLKLQQDLTRLATENQELREKLSVLTTDNAFLRERLAGTQTRSNGAPVVSERRLQMLAARERAMKSGVTTKVGA